MSVEGATENISSDDVVLLDADHGVLTVHPDPSLLPQVAQRIRDLNNARIRQKRLNSRPAETKDGVKSAFVPTSPFPKTSGMPNARALTVSVFSVPNFCS